MEVDSPYNLDSLAGRLSPLLGFGHCLPFWQKFSPFSTALVHTPARPFFVVSHALGLDQLKVHLSGLLISRDFFNALVFRVWFSYPKGTLQERPD